MSTRSASTQMAPFGKVMDKVQFASLLTSEGSRLYCATVLGRDLTGTTPLLQILLQMFAAAVLAYPYCGTTCYATTDLVPIGMSSGLPCC